MVKNILRTAALTAAVSIGMVAEPLFAADELPKNSTVPQLTETVALPVKAPAALAGERVTVRIIPRAQARDAHYGFRARYGQPPQYRRYFARLRPTCDISCPGVLTLGVAY